MTRVYNNLQYKIYKATEDPQAAAFATQLKKDQEAAAAAKAPKAETQPQVKKRSFVQQTLLYTLISFTIFLFILFAAYTGHIVANDAIARPTEYRVLFFIYGAIFSIFVFPYYLVQRFRGHTVRSYAFLPLRQVATLEDGLFAKLFSFVPDDSYYAAVKLYEQSLIATAT